MNIPEFEALPTVSEKATYLLKEEFSVKANISNLDFVQNVYIADLIRTPIQVKDGESEAAAIERAKQWLRDKE